MTEFNIPALQIEHISKSFNAGKNPKKALSDVRFSIEQGDFFGLLGPNGAGKSTLIGVLAKTVTPDSGNVSVLGYDIRRDWQQFNRHRPAGNYFRSVSECMGDIKTAERIFRPASQR